MTKFLAVGVHGAVDPKAGLAIAPQNLAWLRESLASGRIDCAYSMAGGGRLLIATADDEGSLREVLSAAPDVDRTWTITALTDAAESIAKYLEAQTA